MLRSMKAFSALAGMLAVALGIAGCGGGSSGSGSGGTSPTLTPPVAYASFTAFQAGATSTTSLFQDQAVMFDFGQIVDAAPFGGLYVETPGAGPKVYTAVSVVTTGLQYHAFANQQAARQAFRVFPNITGAAQLPSYILGRHATLPRFLVLDPVVPAVNPFGLPGNAGFTGPAPATPPPAPFEYVYIIPFGSALSVGGVQYPSTDTMGGPNAFNLPYPLNPFGTSYSATQFGFAIGPGSGPDPIPPRVDAVVPMSVDNTTVPPTYTPVAGTPADPLPPNGVIKIVFSKKISRQSVDSLTNLTVRNLNIVIGGIPAILPGTFDRIDPVSNLVQTTDTAALLFTPTGGSFGPGVDATTGYDIEVRVGDVSDPTQQILGTPQGTAGTQLPLENQLVATARTLPCILGSPGCTQPPLAITENFNSTAKLDATFAGTWGQARWNSSTDPGKLSGRALTGSPLGNNLTTLGSRIQVTVTPNPLSGPPQAAGLFSPFDASLAATGACGANCGTGGCNIGVNPGGGSRIMHLYEAVDLSSTKDALEYVEWAPVNSTVTPTTYPSMSIWCGLTSLAVPNQNPPPAASTVGLGFTYGTNYNVQPFQSNDPTVTNIIPITNGGNPPNGSTRVVCFGAANYVVPPGFATFAGYPLFTTPFDFANVNGASGAGNNLILEMNIEPGSQCPNFHRYRSTANVPLRRLIGAPTSLLPANGNHVATFGGYDVYMMRFTFVGRRSSVRSLWYDTGLASPTYSGFLLDPSPVPNATGGTDPLLQPAGTRTVWTVDGAGGTTLPGPTTNPAFSGVIIDQNGGVQPTTLNGLTGRRFFRFRTEILSNNVTNGVPSFNNLSVAYN